MVPGSAVQALRLCQYCHLVKMFQNPRKSSSLLQHIFEKTKCNVMMSKLLSTKIMSFKAPWSGLEPKAGSRRPYSEMYSFDNIFFCTMALVVEKPMHFYLVHIVMMVNFKIDCCVSSISFIFKTTW